MQDDRAIVGIKFDGNNLGEGVIGVYDLANTILAFSQVVDNIAVREQLNKKGRIQINVSALKPGSFDVQMVLDFTQIALDAAISATPLLAVISSENPAKYVLGIFQEVLRLKKFLQGKKAKSVTIKQNGDNNVAVVVNFIGNATNTTLPAISSIQDKRVTQALQKMIEPIKKEGSNVDEISFHRVDTGSMERITEREATFFDSSEEVQSIQDYGLKGTITAFDRKTGTGRISVSEAKRIPFDMSSDQALDLVEGNALRLIESMKLKIPVLIKGEATLDFESNVRKIVIQNVEPEARLFESSDR